MLGIPEFSRVLKRGLQRTGSLPLVSGSWEALRAILVIAGWTLSLALVGLLLNSGLLLACLPEVVSLGQGGADLVEGGGVLAVLFHLLLALSVVFSHPFSMAVVVVYLVAFPALWASLGLRHGWALSLKRWEGVVRDHILELSAMVTRAAPEEAVQAVRSAAKARAEVLEKIIQVRDRSGVLVRALSRGPMKIVRKIGAMLHELPGHEGLEVAERALEDIAKEVRFAFPAALGWLIGLNLAWFLLVKVIF
ncbi:MAG: hypothetical protein H6686_01435 [Fibrobacteria bacterium]|nr:hypothetical protein [Fibrobacteria bacterium]